MVAPVTSKTFPTAETHTFMRLFVNLAKQEGGNGLNCFYHHRDLAGPESKLNRPNKDVLYSHGVFDLSAGIDWFSNPDIFTKLDISKIADSVTAIDDLDTESTILFKNHRSSYRN